MLKVCIKQVMIWSSVLNVNRRLLVKFGTFIELCAIITQLERKAKTSNNKSLWLIKSSKDYLAKRMRIYQKLMKQYHALNADRTSLLVFMHYMSNNALAINLHCVIVVNSIFQHTWYNSITMYAKESLK